jgi:PRTRC genetic system ThiF family protein
MTIHYTEIYLMNPPHKVTVDLVGLGGTGSQVLSGLARINESLVALDHPGLFVRAWDPDIVSDANVGRQLFSSADLGLNKSAVLVTRVNRYFGYDWQARSEKYSGLETSNILITCVDSAKARMDIAKRFEKPFIPENPVNIPFYWLDIGNLEKTGQAIIGTLLPVKQPKPKEKIQTTSTLKTVVKKFPQLARIKEEDLGPSCSLAEALSKQDLFINSTLDVISFGKCFVRE